MRTVPRDLLASLVVFLVALPLCMGIAIASGAPPAAGLITGIVGGLVVGSLQGSPLQVSGPAAGLTVIVWDLIQLHGLSTFSAVVLLAGAMQAAAATVKGGRWFRAVPPSVIHGMLAGIGVLIFASQFHVMVDDRPKGSGWLNLLTVPAAIWKGVVPNHNLPHEEAALIGLITITILLLWNRAPVRWRIVPAPIVAVLSVTVIANVFGFPIAYVSVPDSLFATMTFPSTGVFQLLRQSAVWGAALGLAFVASAETLLCATAVDRMHSGPRTQYNRELFAQGVGNMICGVLGALPMTGVIVRSSANVQAGGRTRLSAMLHGLWILVLVAFLPQVLRLVPVAGLAAVLVYTGYKLMNPAMVKLLLKYGRSEVAIYAATVLGIVATDLLKGVLLGLSLAVGKLLLQMSQLDISIEDDAARRRTVLTLRGSATFLRLADVSDALESVPSDRTVHIKFDRLDYLDHATLELIAAWEKQHRSQGGSLVLDWNALERRYQSHPKTVKEEETSMSASKNLYELGDIPPFGYVPSQMHAQVIRPERFGEPTKAFAAEVVQTPKDLRSDEVLVYVMAAGVNYNNVWAGLGTPIDVTKNRPKDPWFPDASGFHIGGSDASGIVWAVGSGVTSVKPGDHVVIHCGQWRAEDAAVQSGKDPMYCPSFRIWGYETSWGSFAQFTRVQAHQCVPKPKHLSWEEAAAYMLVGATAYRMLLGWAPNTIKPNDPVLIWGGAGGLGSMAIQIVRELGGIPVAVISSADKVEFCKRLGARGCINRKDYSHWGIPPHWKDTEGQAKWAESARRFGSAIWEIVGERRNPTIVFEHPGEDTVPTSVFVCDTGGMVVICAGTTGYNAVTDLRYLWMRQKRLQGSHFANDEQAIAFNNLVVEGKIDPCLTETYKFSEIPLSHQLMYENRHPHGNMACLVNAVDKGMGRGGRS